MLKSTFSVFVSILALSTAFVSTPLTAQAKETTIIDLEPQSPWAATMVEGKKPEDGYCVLARKYNKGMILTLGQSARDEYSLAFDFQGKKLNLDKSYKINLQPAPGQLRAYEVMPASARAIVVRLGYDESFLKALEGSSHLKADVDGENYNFKVSDLVKGKHDLKKCVVSLKGDDANSGSSQFAAEKIKNENMTSVSPEQNTIVANEVESASLRKPIQITRVESKTIKEEAAIVTPGSVVVPEKAPVELAKQAVIEKTVSKVEVPTVKVEEKTQAVRVSQVTDVAKDMSQRPEKISAQNKEYGSQVVKNVVVPQKVDNKEASVVKPALVKQTLVANVLAQEVPVKVVEVKPVLKPTPAPVVEKAKTVKSNKIKKNENVKFAEITDVLKDEKRFPKPFSSSVEKTSSKSSQEVVEKKVVEKKPRPPEDVVKKLEKEEPVFMPKRAELEKQNKLIEQEQKMAAQRSAENDLELEKVRKSLNELEKENRALYLEARKARGAVDTAVVETSNEALKKMRAYEKKLEAAQADNLKLSQEIEEMRRIQEDVQISAVGGDVNAEKSIRRFNEAEREIKRLGLLLEQQRMAHRNEKIELENMLFDPAVTDEAQRRKLANLEVKLAEAEERLKLESDKVNKVDLENQNKLRKLEKELAMAKEKEEQLKLEEKRIRVEAQRIAAAEAKLQTMTEKEKALKEKEQSLILKAQEVEKEKAQAQERAMAVAEAKLAEVARKEQEIRAAEKRLSEKAKNIESYSRERVAMASPVTGIASSASALSSASKALTPSARNIRSNPMQNAAIQRPSFGQANLKQLLDKSGISSVSAIRQQTANQFYWKAAGMTGRARIAPKGGSLTQFAHSYIATEKKNCRGDFASLPARVPGGKQGYELACVSGNGGKSSSVVFSQQGNNLMAIAHETTMDNMDAAIDARDKVAKNL